MAHTPPTLFVSLVLLMATARKNG